MKKIYTIEKDGMFLMDTGMQPDWTSKWEDAQFYGSDRQAKQDRDYFGLSLANIMEYEVHPPPVPSEAIPVKEEVKWGVYFIVERHEDKSKETHVKVGYSKDPIKRLKQLQTAHPAKLGMEGWLNCDSEDEARIIESQIHQYFDHIKKQGEWFKFSTSMQMYIELLRKEEHKRFVRYYC